MEKIICIGLLIILVVIIVIKSNKEQFSSNLILSKNTRDIVNQDLVNSCTFDPTNSNNKLNTPFECINNCFNNSLVNDCSTNDCIIQCEKCNNDDICLWKKTSCNNDIVSQQCSFIPEGKTLNDCLDNCNSSDNNCNQEDCTELCNSSINPRMCPYAFNHVTAPKKPSVAPNPPICSAKPIYESIQVSILPNTTDNISDIYKYIIVTKKLTSDICPTKPEPFSENDILSEIQPSTNNKLAIINIKGQNGETLDVSSTYSVYVIAVNSKGASRPSNIVCVKPSISNINASAEIGSVVNGLKTQSLQELLENIEKGDRDAILSSLKVYKEKEEIVNKLSEEVQIFYDLLNNSNISLNIRA